MRRVELRLALTRLRRFSRGILFAAGVLALLPGIVRAEKADRGKAIHLEADRVTVDDAKQIANFIGNVVLTQGTMIMRGERMEVRQDKTGFKQGTMWGNLAYFRQKRDGFDDFIEGWAERVEYDGRADKLQMHNRALLKRGQDEVRGAYISYDSNTEFFQVEGGGGNKSAAAKPGDGRVRIIMQPPARDNASPPASLPLRSDAGSDVPRGEAATSRQPK